MSVTDADLLHHAQAALSDLSAAGPLGLAVSGGGDSVAMLHLMAPAAKAAGRVLRVVTVDHRLRPEAAGEAQMVAGICTRLGIAHDIVKWDHGLIKGNLPDQAARARYGLIAGWARLHGIADVALAHTATDQAETVLMGLSRAAGLEGLCGMRPRFVLGGVQFHRPLLPLTRADLRGFLQRRGLIWAEDPTNDDPRYARVKARRALKTLAPLGITEASLARSAGHLATAQRALQSAEREAALRLCHEVAGAVQLDLAGFAALAPDLQRRVLILCLIWLNGEEYPPRAAGTLRALAAIAEGRAATLAGCRLRLRQGQVLISREPAALGPPVPAGQLWDGRWQVSGPDIFGAEVRALGAAGLASCKGWRALGLPRDALLASPALWLGDRLIAAPLADFGPNFTATLRQSFHEFVLSD